MVEHYTANFFTGNSNWIADIIPFYQSLFEKPKIFLEIGSHEGLSANWICDNILGMGKLHCVDPWTDNHPDLRGIDTFLKNTERNSHKIIAHQGTSKYWLKEFALDEMIFDFIFIDGCHNRDVVIQDGVNAFDLLKVGCYMAFDDYDWMGGDGQEDRPMEAIDCFLKCFGNLIEFNHRGSHVVVKKIKQTRELYKGTERMME